MVGVLIQSSFNRHCMKRIFPLVFFAFCVCTLCAQTTQYNWSGAHFGSGTTQAKRYTIGRVYYNAFHWGTYGVISFKLKSRYLKSGYVEYLVLANQGTDGNHPSLICRGAAGVVTTARIELGVQTSAGTANYFDHPNYYMDIYLDVDYYATWYLEVEATGAYFAMDRTTLASENEYSLMTLYSSPVSTNISSFVGERKIITIPSDSAIIYIGSKLGIGTKDPSAELSVNGTIKARKVTVTQNSWSDYVFNDDYPLMSLANLDSFVRRNRHLPDIPSAKEVAENGINIGDNQALLLKKIEEMALYLIQQQRQIDALTKRNRSFEKHIKTLKKGRF